MDGVSRVVVDWDGSTYALSLAKMGKKYHIVFNSWNGNQFVIHKHYHNMFIFKQHPCVLYCHHTATKRVSTPLDARIVVHATYEKDMSFFITIKDSMKIFTRRNIHHTNDTRRAYNMVRTLLQKYF